MANAPTEAKIAALTDVDETTILYPQTIKSAILDWDGLGGGTTYSPGDGVKIDGEVISSKLSSDSGNALSFGLDKGLFSSGGKRCARVIIGTSKAGWTNNDCDFLCDGINDNVVIQSAFNSLDKNYGEVIFLSGIYKISQRIDSYKVTSIRGSGGLSNQSYPDESLYNGCTVLKWVGTYTNETTITGSSSINSMMRIGYASISNICFDMGDTSKSECNVCLYCDNATNVSNCTFSNCPVGIYISSFVVSPVSNCIFFQYGKAGVIISEGCIASSYFSTTSSVGGNAYAIDARCSSSRKVLIHSNTINGGIIITGASKKTLVHGNILNGTIQDNSTSGYAATIVNNITN